MGYFDHATANRKTRHHALFSFFFELQKSLDQLIVGGALMRWTGLPGSRRISGFEPQWLAGRIARKGREDAWDDEFVKTKLH